MARKFSELEEKLPAEVRAHIEARVVETLAAMPLQKLRSARVLTQKQLAETLQIDQPAVDRLERRTDLYLTTLRHFIEAMNGQLVVQAVFPDGAYTLTHVGEEPGGGQPAASVPARGDESKES